MAVKRRTYDVFSVSFLDCICCGFGAMLLLFVLTIGKSADLREIVISQIQATISRLESDTVKEDRTSGDIRHHGARQHSPHPPRHRGFGTDQHRQDTPRH